MTRAGRPSLEFPGSAPFAFVVLHSADTTQATMAKIVDAESFSLVRGVPVYLPRAGGTRWIDGTVYGGTGTKDVLYLNKYIKSIGKPVVLIGYSSGGFMALRYLWEGMSTVKAIATCCAALLTSWTRKPLASAPPALCMFGVGDFRVKYNGSPGVLSAEQTSDYLGANLITMQSGHCWPGSQWQHAREAMLALGPVDMSFDGLTKILEYVK